MKWKIHLTKAVKVRRGEEITHFYKDSFRVTNLLIRKKFLLEEFQLIKNNILENMSYIKK